MPHAHLLHSCDRRHSREKLHMYIPVEFRRSGNCRMLRMHGVRKIVRTCSDDNRRARVRLALKCRFGKHLSNLDLCDRRSPFDVRRLHTRQRDVVRVCHFNKYISVNALYAESFSSFIFTISEPRAGKPSRGGTRVRYSRIIFISLCAHIELRETFTDIAERVPHRAGKGALITAQACRKITSMCRPEAPRGSRVYYAHSANYIFFARDGRASIHAQPAERSVLAGPARE